MPKATALPRSRAFYAQFGAVWMMGLAPSAVVTAALAGAGDGWAAASAAAFVVIFAGGVQALRELAQQGSRRA
jgi:hypothetical protein